VPRGSSVNKQDYPVPRGSVPVEHNDNIAPCESSILGTLWGSSWARGPSPPIADSRICRSRRVYATPFPLRHVADRLGGRLYGPYRHQTRHYYIWLLRSQALKAAIPIFRTYLPESWKREQFERWLDQHSEFFALDRGAAAPPESLSDTER